MSNKIVTRPSAHRVMANMVAALRCWLHVEMEPRDQELKAICETHFKDRYDLTIVDLYKQQKRAREDQIVVAPTLGLFPEF